MKSLFRCTRCGELVWASISDQRLPVPGQPTAAAGRMCDRCYVEEVEQFLSSWVVRCQVKVFREAAPRAQ
ncbi:MAG: hypothetical protein ACE5JJ_03765 [Nitrospinota bacterium]